MATKEDVLEQVAEEYLLHQGYFVQHNVKFLPRKDHPDFVSNQDSNHSDIDVLGLHPLRQGPDRVIAVSCKSWQHGFRPAAELDAIAKNKTLRGREAWKAFRELTTPKWSEAFVSTVRARTGAEQFTYMLAVAALKGDRTAWETHAPFRAALDGAPIRIVTFAEMAAEVQGRLTKTLASTEVGRMLQMFQVAGWGPPG